MACPVPFLPQYPRTWLDNARQQIPDLGTLREFLDSGARLTTLEREHWQAREALQADFAGRYKGFDTDWAEVRACLNWSDALLQLLPSGRPSPQLPAHAEQPKTASKYEAFASSAIDVVQQYRAQTEPVAEIYNLGAGPWDSWGQANFDDIGQWSATLSQDADSTSDWLLYQAAAAELWEPPLPRVSGCRLAIANWCLNQSQGGIYIGW